MTTAYLVSASSIAVGSLLAPGGNLAVAGSVKAGAFTSPTDADLVLEPGVYSSSPATKRNTICYVGDGNAGHSNQTGAFVMQGSTNIILDSHGIGAGGGDETVNQWKHVYTGVDEGATHDVAVETSFAGSYTFTPRGAAFWQTTFNSASTIGCRFFDNANSVNAFQVTSNGSAFRSTVDAHQGGAIQLASATPTGATVPASGKFWFWYDGTKPQGLDSAGNVYTMLATTSGGAGQLAAGNSISLVSPNISLIASTNVNPNAPTIDYDADIHVFRNHAGGHTNMVVGTPTTGEGGGVGTIFIGECTTIPPNNPTLGFQIYVDPADHKLKAKGASGTITTLALP